MAMHIVADSVESQNLFGWLRDKNIATEATNTNQQKFKQ